MTDIFKYQKEIFSCVQDKLSAIKDKHLLLLEDCDVDFDKATCLSFVNNYWGFVSDPNHPFDKLPSIIQSEVAATLRDCIDNHSSKY